MGMKEAKQCLVGVVCFAIFLLLLLNLTTNRTFFNDNPNDEETQPQALSFQGGEGLSMSVEVGGDGEDEGMREVEKEEMIRLWGEKKSVPSLLPCWDKNLMALKTRPWGYVGVVLSNGPQYHRIQMADAAVIAKYLGATLLLPTVKADGVELNGQFDNIYSTNHFIRSLQNVLRVVGRLPDDMASFTPAVVRVPYEITASFIEEQIKPIFRRSTVIVIGNFFLGNKSQNAEKNPDLEALRCLVMYKALQFHPSLFRLGDHIISRMREAGQNYGGHFLCLDLLLDDLDSDKCNSSDTDHFLPRSRSCVNILGIGSFLRDFGYKEDAAIYLTQTRQDARLDPLTAIFTNIHTKEYSMPFTEEKQIFYSGRTQYEKAVDYYVCSRSDVFVATASDMFYTAIAGERLLLGNTNILVPHEQCKIIANPTNTGSCLSRYVIETNHFVYRCACSVNDTTKI